MLQYLHLYKGNVGSVTPRNSPCATALWPGETQEPNNDTPPISPSLPVYFDKTPLAWN